MQKRELAEHMIRFVQQCLDELGSRDELLAEKARASGIDDESVVQVNRRRRQELKAQLLKRFQDDEVLTTYAKFVSDLIEAQIGQARSELAAARAQAEREQCFYREQLRVWEQTDPDIRRLEAIRRIGQSSFPLTDPQSTRSRGLFMAAAAGLKHMGSSHQEFRHA